MATPRTIASTADITDEEFDQIIEQDPGKPGRHNARFVEYGTHIWSIIGGLQRANGDISQVASE